MYSSKRARSVDSDEEDDFIVEPVGKKQCFLPLRLSPTSSSKRDIKQTSRPIGPYTLPVTLTPVESSDEDVENEPITNLSAFNISQPSNAGTFGSNKENATEGSVMDAMEMPPPSATVWKKPQLTRQRSNGISCAGQTLQTIISTCSQNPDPNSERLPTPIYGHFTSTDVNMDTSEAAMNSFIHPAARFQLRHNNHNILSPMMSEDGESEADWWRKRRLPSPGQSPVVSNQMETDDLPSPGMMDALSFDNIRTHNSEMDRDLITSPPPTTSSTNTSKGHAMFERRSDMASDPPRKGKLVMGFRADCSKCQKRVPGHYSHIVWD